MLRVNDVHKTYEESPLLEGVSFIINPDETVCLLGPSGSGKSTLLRIIAGLEQAESGAILWDEKDLHSIPAYQRNFGLMFQDYALFPHRTVAQNVAFGLRMQKLPTAEVQARTNQALETIHMLNLSRRRVTDLSGGEQQRVALARALAPNPRLLMLDEPLGALDRALREQLSRELRRNGDGRGATIPSVPRAGHFCVTKTSINIRYGPLLWSGMCARSSNRSGVPNRSVDA